MTPNPPQEFAPSDYQAALKEIKSAVSLWYMKHNFSTYVGISDETFHAIKSSLTRCAQTPENVSKPDVMSPEEFAHWVSNHNLIYGGMSNSGYLNAEEFIEVCNQRDASIRAQAIDEQRKIRKFEVEQCISGMKVIEKNITLAASALLIPDNGISDTVWLYPNGYLNITLLDHLVSFIDVKLTGVVEEDYKLLSGNNYPKALKTGGSHD